MFQNVSLSLFCVPVGASGQVRPAGGGPPLPPRTAVDTADGLSFIPGPDVGGGVELVVQTHGGALLSGGKPGNAGRRFAERQARRRSGLTRSRMP